MRVETEQRGPTRAEPPVADVLPAVASSADVPEGLDWQTFAAVYFPGRRRHDLEAVTAYGRYRLSHAPEGR